MLTTGVVVPRVFIIKVITMPETCEAQHRGALAFCDPASAHLLARRSALINHAVFSPFWEISTVF